jgi:hypothetical protein
MATVNLSRDSESAFGVAIGWSPLTTTNVDGQPWDTRDYADISVQVIGTFGVGGSVKLQGSNQAAPTDWADLNDPQANPLAYTAAKIEQVLEMPRWIRPLVTAGDGSTSLTVALWARRSR